LKLQEAICSGERRKQKVTTAKGEKQIQGKPRLHAGLSHEQPINDCRTFRHQPNDGLKFCSATQFSKHYELIISSIPVQRSARLFLSLNGVAALALASSPIHPAAAQEEGGSAAGLGVMAESQANQCITLGKSLAFLT